MAEPTSGKHFGKVIQKTVFRTKEKVFLFLVNVHGVRILLTLNKTVTLHTLESDSKWAWQVVSFHFIYFTEHRQLQYEQSTSIKSVP